MIQRFQIWLRNQAWPDFDCEDCIGMIHYGCQCAVLGASAPGTPPTRWQGACRWVLSFLFPPRNDVYADT